MPSKSSVALLQQATTLGLLGAALAWLLLVWDHSRAGAVAGALALMLVHAAVLGVEFLLLPLARRGDPAPRASLAQLAGAWLREVGVASRVFAWRQPFAWRKEPDRLQGRPGATGILFVHGFLCNRGFWTPWLREARSRGHAFIAVNLEPAFGSIDDYGRTIDQAVARLQQATGRPPLLVCHSMGGLAARAWLRTSRNVDRVAHVVTIGTPHHGTWLARFSRMPNGRQMRIGGDWLLAMGALDPQAARLFTCWYTNCDNIVLPPSTATLPGADNRLLAGAAHVDLAFRPALMQEVFALVGRT
ncbi:alpha/beta fold hydrolase [Ramlibacter tataouinensis]|uniref:esterase/lipase family protein n=1 Tax=Ramlibacter tataouinensis TaxID=94132 RepID=UPI0022F384B0|nr:alpha/beta fold hydrolase [Ramlibacter tataouinensis]WBY00423.1 alpha/beta fold hydrolase [Ramlibacter tataouinensis]